ncbi:MAG: lipopolysaccharide transport periplasmic protein LptA [Kistimonas sp.]|nr:lipopolysaccharide transport periplasmic protein LptA [Kistimonas sp.]
MPFVSLAGQRTGITLTLLFRLLTASVATETAWALPEDRNKEIHIQADSADFDQKAGTAVYRGRVVMTQGTIRLTGDLVRLWFKDKSIDRLVAQGKGQLPATYSETLTHREGGADTLHARGQTIDYDRTAQLLVLEKQAHLERGDRRLKGDRIVYNKHSQRASAKGLPGQDGRIQMALQPRSSAAGTAASP